MTVYALQPTVREDALPVGVTTVCALGVFDGVHIGHTALLQQTVRLARQCNALPIVYTFFDLGVKKSEQLTDLTERLALFAQAGIAYAVLADFDGVRGASCADFVNGTLLARLHACGAVCGENYRFGAGATGDATTLGALLSAQGAFCYTVPSVCCSADGALPPEALALAGACSAACVGVSSTVIRTFLQAGHPEWARELLGRPYAVSAPVLHGRRLGRTLGFPTANQSFPKGKVRLPNGVYLCRGRLCDGRILPGVCNVGRNPTVAQDIATHLETHLLTDEPLCLYDTSLTVYFEKRLRGEQTFADLDELKEAIAQNVAQAKGYFER
jgi:riboflavin kinase/FMN adenylyltransferase